MTVFKKSILFILVISLAAFCISWDMQDARLIKKLDKQITKVWKNESIKKHQIQPSAEVSVSENRQFFKLFENETLRGYAILSRSYGCRVGGCAAYSSTADKSGSYDPFYYSIITDKDLIIKNVTVLEFYSEYGYEITNKSWLRQFVGSAGKNLEYGQDIDAISGATISAKSLLDDVELACKTLQEMSVDKPNSD